MTDKFHTRIVDSVIDVISKILLTAVSACVFWIVGSVNGLKEQSIRSEERQISNTKAMEDFAAFTRQPRFTRENFIIEMAPYKQMILRHDEELTKYQDWTAQTERRLNRVEAKMNIN